MPITTLLTSFFRTPVKTFGGWLCLLFLKSLLLVIPCNGQVPAEEEKQQFNIRHFTDENGLPQNSVKSIVEDKDGFIWLSTENGLVRYDGQTFYNFDNRRIPVRSNRMGSFYPVNLERDSLANSFFAFSDRYDYITVRDGIPSSSRTGFENFLADMPYSDEVRRNKAIISQSLPNLFAETFDTEKCLIPDNKGGVFVCRRENVTYYRGKQKQYETAFAADDLWAFFRMGNSLFWTDYRGVFRRIGKEGPQDLILDGDLLHHPGFVAGKTEVKLFWNNGNANCFIYFKKRLYQIKETEPGILKTRLILYDFDFTLNNIISVHYDETIGRVFLGSTNKGLFSFIPKQFTTLVIGTNDTDDIYYAQAAWGPDRVLTTQGIVRSLNDAFVLPVMKQESRSDKYSLLIDSIGQIWTRSGDFVKKFDKTGKKLISKWNAGKELTQVYAGKGGRIWIGSRTLGIFYVDRLDSAIVPSHFYTPNLIEEISCFAQDNEDFLWVGTGTGLYRIHLPTSKIDTIKGLKESYIRSIYLPQPGEVWITTYGSGFYLYSNEKLTTFPLDRAGYLSTSHCIVEDDAGYCWISSNRGLFQATRKDLLNYAAGKQDYVFYLYHTREEGFNTNEFNGGCQPCAVKLQNGYISLPSLNGLVWFAPATFKPVLPDKGLYIDRIEVDQQMVIPDDTIRLSQRFEILKVHCLTPYSGDAENIRMEYAWIKGDDKPQWSPVDNISNVVSLLSTGYGNYTLIIRKIVGFGKDNYSYRKLTVIVPPAFHETFWFYAMLVVFFILILWLYEHLRLRYIRYKTRQLEQLISERTSELEQTLQALSASEQQIRRQMQIREVVFTAISHDIGSPLKYITMMAEGLKNDLEAGNAKEKERKQASEIFQSGHYLYHLTRNLLQYLRISENSTDLQYEEFDLHQLVEKKVAIFQLIAKRIKVINNIPDQFFLYNDPLLLEVVIHNLLDNAIKVTRQGSVAVSASKVNGLTHIVITDTGPGMRKEIADKYNNNDIPTSGTLPDDITTTGFGLHIVRELTKLIGVRIQIETGKQGTRFYLLFLR